MIALGVLNESNSPGEPAYGIPHPGVFVVNTDNEIAVAINRSIRQSDNIAQKVADTILAIAGLTKLNTGSGYRRLHDS